MTTIPPTTVARGTLANLVKSGASPEAIADARRTLAASNIQAAIARALAVAPPLTDAQCERLAERLRGVE